MDAFRMRVGVASPPRDPQVIKPVAAAAPNIAATRYRIGNSSSDGDHALAELSSSNIGLLFPRALLSAIASRASPRQARPSRFLKNPRYEGQGERVVIGYRVESVKTSGSYFLTLG